MCSAQFELPQLIQLDVFTFGCFQSASGVHPIKDPVLPLAFRKGGAALEASGSSVWSAAEVNAVTVTHVEPEGIADRIALAGVKLLRCCFGNSAERSKCSE